MPLVRIDISKTASCERVRDVQHIADEIHAKQGVRKQDIWISLVDSGREDWSFGNGDAVRPEVTAARGRQERAAGILQRLSWSSKTRYLTAESFRLNCLV
jgi:hypothetical protein